MPEHECLITLVLTTYEEGKVMESDSLNKLLGSKYGGKKRNKIFPSIYI